MKRSRLLMLIGSFAYLGTVAIIFRLFLPAHESTMELSGIQPPDPVMNALPAMDLSLWIFTITYGALVTYVILERKKTYFLEKGLIAYGTLILLRMLSMTLIPLKAPNDFVYLQDPFLNNVIYPGNIKHDLFFSGHAGLVLIFAFLSKRWVFVILVFILSAFLMVQRVHYFYDILGALPFALLSTWFVEKAIFARLRHSN